MNSLESSVRQFRFAGLLQRQLCWRLTWRGWLALLGTVGLLIVFVIRAAYPFLALSAPVDAEMLVVEGWEPDYALRESISQFHQRGGREILVTGGPIERGEPLVEYKTYADLGAAALRKLGVPAEAIVAVPAPAARKDRTFASAVALQAWFTAHGRRAPAINIVTLGAHSRRTRLLFEAAFDGTTSIGVLPVAPQDFDAGHWWASSEGFRTVTGEAIAYLYARLVFRGAAR